MNTRGIIAIILAIIILIAFMVGLWLRGRQLHNETGSGSTPATATQPGTQSTTGATPASQPGYQSAPGSQQSNTTTRPTPREE